jgi:hypothetical protein
MTTIIYIYIIGTTKKLLTDIFVFYDMKPEAALFLFFSSGDVLPSCHDAGLPALKSWCVRSDTLVFEEP